MAGVLHVKLHVIQQKIDTEGGQYSHFTDEESEAQRQ